MQCDGILEAIGHTPLIRMQRLYPDLPLQLYAKMEGLNPAGSSKDRPARAILGEALENGELTAETVVIESSSGNMGIGLAQFCRFHGIRFICVVDIRTSEQNLAILRAYGAELEVVEEPDESGDLLKTRLNRVRRLREENPTSFWPDQYANRMNDGSHYQTTIQEIIADLDGSLDFLFCAVSTCGTLRGCSEYVRDHALKTQVIAVDSEGSIIFGGEPQRRLIPGLGAGKVPDLCAPDLVSEVVHVSDVDCIKGCRRLLQREAIFAGGSSGGVVEAVRRLAPKIPPGSRCACILPDRGERYLQLVYSDDWVRKHFGSLEVLEGG
jgi:cysteine synthase A